MMRMYYAMAAAGLSLTCHAALGQAEQSTAGVAQAGARLVSTEARLKDAIVRLDNAKQRLARAKQRYEAGSATADEMEEAKSQVERLEIELKEAEKVAVRQEQVDRLSRPVDVQFKDATVQQAAESLSKASNVPVRVAAGVPAGARITLEARAVPLATVLESIARHLELRIAPGQNGGVELQAMPEIVIDGHRQVLPDTTGPWSPAWGDFRPWSNVGGTGFGGFGGLGGGINDLRSYGLGGAIGQSSGYGGNSLSGTANTGTGQNLTRGGSVSNSGQGLTNTVTGALSPRNGVQLSTPANTAANRLQLNNSVMGGYTAPSQAPAAGGLLQGVNIAAVGNTLVVAEPGRGPSGEPGAWLTVYLLEGVNLVKKSSLFHPTRSTLVLSGGGFGGQNSGSAYQGTTGFGGFGGGQGTLPKNQPTTSRRNNR